MSKPAFERDGILSPSERAESARKCLSILDADTESTDDMRANDYSFYVDQQTQAKSATYAPTERQLAWLRDLVEKYAC